MNISSPILIIPAHSTAHPPDMWKGEDDEISERLAGTEIKTHQTQLKCGFIPPSFLLYDVSKNHLCPAKEKGGGEKKTWLNKVNHVRVYTGRCGECMKQSSPTPRFYSESLCWKEHLFQSAECELVSASESAWPASSCATEPPLCHSAGATGVPMSDIKINMGAH